MRLFRKEAAPEPCLMMEVFLLTECDYRSNRDTIVGTFNANGFDVIEKHLASGELRLQIKSNKRLSLDDEVTNWLNVGKEFQSLFPHVN